MTTTADSLLSVRGLTASVDEKTILHGVNLDVAAGETHVLMGPNGAGKSTLGHLVMGDPAYSVDEGSIFFDGQDVTELAGELNMDVSYLNRELGVGFSGGEKKKVEMLQLLLLQPKLAILDETDSGLDVDALGVVSRGMDAYRKQTDGSLLIITHNTRILEHLKVDRVHVMVNGRIVREDDASLIPWIDANGFDTFEREAAAQLEAERAAHEGDPSRDAAIDAVRAAASSLGAGMVQSLRATLDANGTADAADNTAAANTAAAADAAAGETR